MESWKTMEPHNIQQKRKHPRKVGEWSITEMNPIKPTPLISCESPPLILHSQTPSK